MEPNKQLVCVIDFGTGKQDEIVIPPNRWLDDFKNGFWVDVNLKWCVEATKRYWIPPSRILYVELRPI